MRYTFKEGLTIDEARAAYCTRRTCGSCELAQNKNRLLNGL